MNAAASQSACASIDRAKSLEALGRARRRRYVCRSLEQQLGDELRRSFATRRVAYGAGVDQHDDRHERKLRHMRDDERNTVGERATLESRKVILARRARLRARGVRDAVGTAVIRASAAAPLPTSSPGDSSRGT